MSGWRQVSGWRQAGWRAGIIPNVVVIFDLIVARKNYVRRLNFSLF